MDISSYVFEKKDMILENHLLTAKQVYVRRWCLQAMLWIYSKRFDSTRCRQATDTTMNRSWKTTAHSPRVPSPWSRRTIHTVTVDLEKHYGMMFHIYVQSSYVQCDYCTLLFTHVHVHAVFWTRSPAPHTRAGYTPRLAPVVFARPPVRYCRDGAPSSNSAPASAPSRPT